MELHNSSRNLRFIDVEQHCIVVGPWHTLYVALSYVWGGACQFRLLKANKADLATPGFLLNVINLVPKTIQDTIDLVHRLGSRYLWVDSLCLVQDDEEDMAEGISMMDAIYEGAILTVIAATGNDANAGLPRFRKKYTPSYRNHFTTKRGLKIIFIRALDSYLGKSVWSSRGWT